MSIGDTNAAGIAEHVSIYWCTSTRLPGNQLKYWIPAQTGIQMSDRVTAHGAQHNENENMTRSPDYWCHPILSVVYDTHFYHHAHSYTVTNHIHLHCLLNHAQCQLIFHCHFPSKIFSWHTHTNNTVTQTIFTAAVHTMVAMLFSTNNLDIDECNLNIDGCAQICTNINGSYICSCMSGLSLSTNGHSCIGRLIIICTMYCIVHGNIFRGLFSQWAWDC